MNGHEHDQPLDPASEAWRELDDTLADGPSPAEVPDEAKVWLGRQRFVHGLLRALHTADAAAREGRIAAILDRIDRDRTEAPRRWWLVAAAALTCRGAGSKHDFIAVDVRRRAAPSRRRPIGGASA